jgi:hypothetical protein
MQVCVGVCVCVCIRESRGLIVGMCVRMHVCMYVFNY